MAWPFSKSPTEASAQRTRVLIIDDSEPDAALTLRAMQQAGVKDCRRAPTAEDGLRDLMKQEYDVVLANYQLPRMSGIDFLKAARELYPELRVILLTTTKEDRIAATATKAGAVACLSREEFLTAGLIGAVQSFMRADEPQETLSTAEAQERAAVTQERVASETSWLKSSAASSFKPLEPSLYLEGPDIESAVAVCELYLQRLIDLFPDRPVKEEDVLVELLVEQGSSPREALFLLEGAFSRLLAKRSLAADLPFSPSLPIARIFIRLVEAYQGLLAVDALEQYDAYERAS